MAVSAPRLSFPARVPKRVLFVGLAAVIASSECTAADEPECRKQGNREACAHVARVHAPDIPVATNEPRPRSLARSGDLDPGRARRHWSFARRYRNHGRTPCARGERSAFVNHTRGEGVGRVRRAVGARRALARGRRAGWRVMIVNGSLRVPGDKSISHRALMLAALGDGWRDQ